MDMFLACSAKFVKREQTPLTSYEFDAPEAAASFCQKSFSNIAKGLHGEILEPLLTVITNQWMINVVNKSDGKGI